MKNIFSQLGLLYYVGEFNSYSKAARFLGCSKAYISKQISDLERSVGSVLLHRNTRSIQFTSEGEALFEHAKMMVLEFQHAENTIANLQQKISGNLKITAPSGFTDYVLAPHLHSFLEMYPELNVEMNITGELVNLVEEKIDVAIRLTHEPPLDRIAKRIGNYQMIVCASSDYLDKYGEPHHPELLSNYACLNYSTEKLKLSWPFIIKGDHKIISIQPKLNANNSQIILQSLINGEGIARLPDYIVKSAIAENKVKRILTEFYPPSIPIYAVYTKSRIIPPKIHAFIKFLQSIFK